MFPAQLFKYPGPGGWTFARIPEEHALPATHAWGRTPVFATVDGERWSTSVWRDRAHGTLLPIPAKIRGAKQDGDTVMVTLEPRGSLEVPVTVRRRSGPRGVRTAGMGRSDEVDAWFARYQNPMKDVVERIRAIVLDADARIGECIKWQAPTFTYQGNLASFYPKSSKHASLMFHLGAKIPGKHPRLEGTGDTSRVMKLGTVADANAAKPELEAIVRAWCDWRDAEAARPKAAPPKRGKPAKRPKAKAKKTVKARRR